jgi:hypothetical protein
MIFLRRSELIARSAWLLTWGAALMSAFLAPTILGAASLGLLALVPTWTEFLHFVIITMPLGALFGGLAMHLALRVRSAWMLVGAACAGGVLFLLGTAVLHAVFEAEAQTVLAAVLIFGLYGGFFSAPCGILFGFILLGMFIPSQRHLTAPAQDSPAHVARLVARVFFLAAALALLSAWFVEEPYGSALSHLIFELSRAPLSAESVAWTRLLFATPLALMGLLFWATGHLREMQLHAMRAAIGKRTHNAWSVSDIEPDYNATPLTEADRLPSIKRLLEPSEGGSPYRGSTHELVFVALAATRERGLSEAPALLR